jgi:hypothetical protein
MFTFFSSNNILTLKIITSFKRTSSFLYRIWNVLLQIRESWTEAGKAKVIPKTDKIHNWQVKDKNVIVQVIKYSYLKILFDQITLLSLIFYRRTLEHYWVLANFCDEKWINTYIISIIKLYDFSYSERKMRKSQGRYFRVNNWFVCHRQKAI